MLFDTQLITVIWQQYQRNKKNIAKEDNAALILKNTIVTRFLLTGLIVRMLYEYLALIV